MFSNRNCAALVGLVLHATFANAAVHQHDAIKAQTGLWEISPNAAGITVWFSNITDTIFGEDATDFDYYLGGDYEHPGNLRHFDAAIETVEHFAKVYPDGDADALLVAFENYSMAGTLTAEQAADRMWLCKDLDCPMNRIADACKDLEVPCSVWERAEL